MNGLVSQQIPFGRGCRRLAARDRAQAAQYEASDSASQRPTAALRVHNESVTTQSSRHSHYAIVVRLSLASERPNAQRPSPVARLSVPARSRW